MPPLWKVKRELDRLKVQARAVPQAIYEPFVQRQYDKNRSRDLKVETGETESSDQICIFLLYQPRGIAASTFQTLLHLKESGLASLVVSNTQLRSEDKARLIPHALGVIERPNFGYDFGGYRDGLWYLERSDQRPKEILFLNDSVWFPAWANSTLLSEISHSSADYIGTQVFGDVSKNAKKRGIFGSYCFAVKEPLLSSAEFKGFWRNYRLSSNKEVVLRRGERAFSHRMFATAESILGLYSQQRFKECVNNLDESGLVEALSDMVALDPDLERTRRAYLEPTGAGWTDKARDILKAGARSKNYIGAHPVLSLREMGFPMIKKNNEMLYRRARKRILSAIDEGRLPGIEPIVLKELRELSGTDNPD